MDDLHTLASTPGWAVAFRRGAAGDPGISSKVLTQRLRMLEEHGIVYRHHVPSIPPKVSYGLTAHGAELGDVFDALENVSRRWLARGLLEREGRGAATSPPLSPPASRLNLWPDDR